MTPVAAVEGELGFAPPDEVGPDHERAGLLRARTHPRGEPEIWDVHVCALRDGDHPDAPTHHLAESGFEAVDLSGNEGAQDALARIRADDRITDTTAADLRSALVGTTLRLADGRGLRVDFIADDGLINRRSGPAGLRVNGNGSDARNGHEAATGVHADQDVYGVPLAKLMDGAAPGTFRHRTPDGANSESSTFLLNVWIPLQQVTKPLVLMDRRTLDQAAHQLRYGLPVDGFLERDEDERVNDIWKFLHHPDQEWWFHADMGPDRCYVFDTLGTPHGAAVLPGEDALEALYVLLDDACAAVAVEDHARVADLAASAVPTLSAATTAPVRAAYDRMMDLLRAATTDPAWAAEARAAMDAVIRKSVELRAVATVVD